MNPCMKFAAMLVVVGWCGLGAVGCARELAIASPSTSDDPLVAFKHMCYAIQEGHTDKQILRTYGQPRSITLNPVTDPTYRWHYFHPTYATLSLRIDFDRSGRVARVGMWYARGRTGASSDWYTVPEYWEQEQ